MDMKKMMKQAQRMQAELAKAQDEIKELEFEATAGGGMVKVVAKGDMTIQSIAIDPEAVDPEDVDMLQDMVLAAVNEALRGVSDLSAQRLNAATGGMNIPGPHVAAASIPRTLARRRQNRRVRCASHPETA